MLAEKHINIPPPPDVCMKDVSYARKKYSSLTSSRPTAWYNIPYPPTTPKDFNLASVYIRNVRSSPFFGTSAGQRTSLNVALLQYLDFIVLHRKKEVVFRGMNEKKKYFSDGERLLQPLVPP